METTLPYRPTSNSPARFPLKGVVIFVFAVAVGIALSHALIHGKDAIDARNCFDNRGPVMRWFNPFRETYIMVCQEQDGGPVYLRVLRRVKGKIEEITAYRKDQVFHLEDMAKILEDQGAVLEWVK